MPEPVTTEDLLDHWQRAESAKNTLQAGTLTWLLALDRSDEARRAYQARIAEIAATKRTARR
jgi:hypothetical protein